MEEKEDSRALGFNKSISISNGASSQFLFDTTDTTNGSERRLKFYNARTNSPMAMANVTASSKRERGLDKPHGHEEGPLELLRSRALPPPALRGGTNCSAMNGWEGEKRR
ncbi:MAG: hypothetical protein Q9191_000519 [Dirinaria sp. TL-2023a]